MKLIAFTGLKTAGKTTAKEYFMALDKYPVQMSFATPLKRALLAMGFSHAEIYRMDKEETIPPFGKSYRTLMQTLGTDWGRNMIHKDIWLFMFERQYRLEVKSGTTIVVIDDIRYDNEADLIRSLGGKIIRVVRDGLVSTDTHSSERGISDNLIDHTIHNTGLVTEFHITLRNLYHHLYETTI